MLSPPPSLLSPTSPLAFKTLNPPLLHSASPHLFFPLPLSRHHRRLLCLASSHNSSPIQSVLYPSITDPASTHLPAVRTYESDLAILSISGSVSSNQAVAAAAADGGVSAEEHLSSGAEAMVVETVFPGYAPDGNSSISTKLFLPVKKVKEKAKKLRKSTGAGSNNILPMTFRQVVMDQLWNFNLTVLAPGSERKSDDLGAPREVKTNFTVSSSDEKFLSSLSEALCTLVIVNSRSSRYNKSNLKNSSSDSSISIHTMAEADVVNYVMNEPAILNLVRKGKPSKNYLWEPPSYRMLEEFCSREMVDRMHWFVPVYRLQVMLNTFKDLKLEGWREVAANRLEAFLTHFQMMELTNILDLYYEDQYTLPGKKLLCGPLLEPVNPTRNTGSFLKVLLVTMTGIFVISFLGIVARVFGAHVSKPKLYAQENFTVCTSENNAGLYSTNSDVTKEICKLVVEKTKGALGSSGEVMFKSNLGAWIGTVPSYLRGTDPVNPDLANYTAEEISNEPSVLEKKSEIQETAQDIAGFQVVLSEQGEIVGFQPTSRSAVRIWASHPLAKELYKGHKLTPGILEPNLKIPCPRKVVVIELLMSTNPNSFFALARPIRGHGGLILAKG